MYILRYVCCLRKEISCGNPPNQILCPIKTRTRFLGRVYITYTELRRCFSSTKPKVVYSTTCLSPVKGYWHHSTSPRKPIHYIYIYKYNSRQLCGIYMVLFTMLLVYDGMTYIYRCAIMSQQHANIRFNGLQLCVYI